MSAQNFYTAITRAAKQMGLTKQTVSERIGKLEDRAGQTCTVHQQRTVQRPKGHASVEGGFEHGCVFDDLE